MEISNVASRLSYPKDADISVALREYEQDSERCLYYRKRFAEFMGTKI